jgi:hypothetical protein
MLRGYVGTIIDMDSGGDDLGGSHITENENYLEVVDENPFLYSDYVLFDGDS